MFAVMSVGSVPTFGHRHVDAAFSSQEKRAVQKRPRTVNEFHVRFVVKGTARSFEGVFQCFALLLLCLAVLSYVHTYTYLCIVHIHFA